MARQEATMIEMADFTDQRFTAEQWEYMKIALVIVFGVPALIVGRFLLFMVLPKSVIKYLFLGKRSTPELHKDKTKIKDRF
jgi:hypothetical protein